MRARYERMNKCQNWDVFAVLLPGHACVKKYPINSIPFLHYCSCLIVAYLAGVGKYGPRVGCGPQKIQFSSNLLILYVLHITTAALECIFVNFDVNASFGYYVLYMYISCNYNWYKTF